MSDLVKGSFMKKERKFLTQVRDSFHYYGAFYYKISDMPHFAGMMSRFDSKKPFDVLAAFEGHAIAIEAKFQNDYGGFGLRKFAEHQIEALDEFSLNGSSFVFLNIRQLGNKEKGLKRFNRLFIFEWDLFKARGLIPKSELLEWPYMEYKNGIFNISDWLYDLRT